MHFCQDEATAIMSLLGSAGVILLRCRTWAHAVWHRIWSKNPARGST